MSSSSSTNNAIANVEFPEKITSNFLKEIFDEQKKYVDYFFTNLDHSLVEQFTKIVLDCKGLIFLTGMGKSGIIARNISQMLVSVGIRAMYMSPVDALHGDVGVMTSKDVLVLLSKSGQTSELINLIPAVRNKKVFVVAVVSNPDGQLAHLSDVSIHLPLQKELCPFDMAPTTSSIIQLIFGNTVVAAIMKATNLTREAYAMNHPAGRIGKRLTVKVDDVMRSPEQLGICKPTDTLVDQIGLMSAKRCGCLLVEENDVLVGIFTDGDLRRAIEQDGASALNQPIGQLMKRGPATCLSGEMAYDAMLEMERSDASRRKKRVKELPVVDHEGRIKGLVLLHDVVEFGL